MDKQKRLEGQTKGFTKLYKEITKRDIKEISSVELEGWRAQINNADCIGDAKEIARNFRDLFGLNDYQTTSILFRNKNISEIREA